MFDGEVALYFPMEHVVHELCASEPWKYPFAQALQPVATEDEYWPDEQTPETAMRPATAQNEPAGHDEHEPEPELCWK